LNVVLDGEVYYPPNEDLSTAPNGGFSANEDQFTIWGDISSKRSKAMIHWKFPTLKDDLAKACAVTCDRTC
jgi:hypothetical protein